MVLEEGLENRFARHRLNHVALSAGLAALGIRASVRVAESHRLPMLAAARIPDGVDDAAIRRNLLERFNIEISGGLGALKGKAWRIGVMGHGSRRENVLAIALGPGATLGRTRPPRNFPAAAVAARRSDACVDDERPTLRLRFDRMVRCLDAQYRQSRMESA